MNSIKSILEEPTGVKVYKLTCPDNISPYITYQFYNEYGETFAENKEIATAYSVQINIFAKGNFSNLYNQIVELMTKAGWYRTFATELYEDDTKLFHKLIRFQYTQECQ